MTDNQQAGIIELNQIAKMISGDIKPRGLVKALTFGEALQGLLFGKIVVRLDSAGQFKSCSPHGNSFLRYENDRLMGVQLESYFHYWIPEINTETGRVMHYKKVKNT